MDTFRPSKGSRQAYIQRELKALRPRSGVVFGAGRVMQEGTGLGADLFRHVVTLIGVFGLVGIAVGATTENRFYHQVLNWVTSLFV